METSTQKELFLQAFANGSTVHASAAQANVEKRTVRQWELEDPAFAQVWAVARRQRLRDLAYDLVLEEGVEVSLIKALLELEQEADALAEKRRERAEKAQEEVRRRTPLVKELIIKPPSPEGYPEGKASSFFQLVDQDGKVVADL